jgi:hypothetical protein
LSRPAISLVLSARTAHAAPTLTHPLALLGAKLLHPAALFRRQDGICLGTQLLLLLAQL